MLYSGFFFFSFLSLFATQAEQNVRANYLQDQEVTGNMRAILIDWLVQVSLKFRLLQETMYMTVGIIDRFLQVNHQSAACFMKRQTKTKKWSDNLSVCLF